MNNDYEKLCTAAVFVLPALIQKHIDNPRYSIEDAVRDAFAVGHQFTVVAREHETD